MIVYGSSLRNLDGVAHAFFTRLGGVSTGLYHSLNCSYGSHDEREAVIENRRRAMARLDLPANALVTCYQVHGVDVLTINGGNPPVGKVYADALVTNRRGMALGVLTADCAPILLADINAGVIGAIHAGWRGALAGVLEAGTKAIEGTFNIILETQQSDSFTGDGETTEFTLTNTSAATDTLYVTLDNVKTTAWTAVTTTLTFTDAPDDGVRIWVRGNETSWFFDDPWGPWNFMKSYFMNSQVL